MLCFDEQWRLSIVEEGACTPGLRIQSMTRRKRCKPQAKSCACKDYESPIRTYFCWQKTGGRWRESGLPGEMAAKAERSGGTASGEPEPLVSTHKGKLGART